MIFSKLAEIFSSAATRLSAPKASPFSYKSPGLPPNPGSLHGYHFSSPEKKSNLRLSSSLQDFSTYRRLDLEEGNLTAGVERISGHALPPYSLQKENGVSSFSKEKISPGISPRRKKWVRVICVLLCLLLIGGLSFSLQFLYSSWFRGPSKFYVIMDCGSTGTRVYIYEASINRKKGDNLPIHLKSLPEAFQGKSRSQSGRAYNRMETEPGFDKLVHNISGLREAIRPLIQRAEKQIPKKSHKTTSLFLYATAGVRRLPSSDSEWLLNNAWSILNSSPFLCKKEWVKIITGMEEAYYGWIALNYHTGVLGSLPKKETYGALDLGGSSLQVTFEGKQHDNDESSLKLSIGPVNHHLSAYSLAGYGLNDAFDKSVAYLLKRLPQINNADLVNGKVEINHPCLQSGYNEQYLCSHCSSIHPQDGSSPIGVKTSRKQGKTGIPVQLVGVPNWAECSGLAKVVVNLSEWSDNTPGIDCELQPCALQNNLPRPGGQFYAMSGFFVVYRFFNLTPDAALDDVLEKGREFCEKTWDVARKSVVPQPFIEQYCFRAPYVVLLLREGLHITDSQVIIGSGSITWTLGVALFEAGKAFPFGGKFRSYDIFQVKQNPFVLLALLFASLFVLLCVLSCVGNFRRPYLPLFRHNSVTSTSVLNIPAPFRFQRWSRPINTGDGRAKMPLSPTVASTQQNPFDTGLGFGGGGIQLTESSLYSSSSSVAHSYSSGSLGQMQFDNSTLGSFWTPNRSQMRLQSRRSQSREDLISSIAEAHIVKI
ncbi:Nucleoside phosphatase [Handroanthus impetiginosus]|uniref:Nucleoside phosphatase n=1 Tax=Handroanthus impetiginosus TaxID=429701 RepID=A0A2G9HAM9_9LAMI|nr:Nucleoside phosphatase [Handroanthus impetiginosus]